MREQGRGMEGDTVSSDTRRNPVDHQVVATPRPAGEPSTSSSPACHQRSPCHQAARQAHEHGQNQDRSGLPEEHGENSGCQLASGVAPGTVHRVVRTPSPGTFTSSGTSPDGMSLASSRNSAATPGSISLAMSSNESRLTANGIMGLPPRTADSAKHCPTADSPQMDKQALWMSQRFRSPRIRNESSSDRCSHALRSPGRGRYDQVDHRGFGQRGWIVGKPVSHRRFPLGLGAGSGDEGAKIDIVI